MFKQKLKEKAYKSFDKLIVELQERIFSFLSLVLL